MFQYSEFKSFLKTYNIKMKKSGSGISFFCLVYNTRVIHLKGACDVLEKMQMCKYLTWFDHFLSRIQNGTLLIISAICLSGI